MLTLLIVLPSCLAQIYHPSLSPTFHLTVPLFYWTIVIVVIYPPQVRFPLDCFTQSQLFSGKVTEAGSPSLRHCTSIVLLSTYKPNCAEHSLVASTGISRLQIPTTSLSFSLLIKSHNSHTTASKPTNSTQLKSNQTSKAEKKTKKNPFPRSTCLPSRTSLQLPSSLLSQAQPMGIW